MAQQLVTALETALAECAAADLSLLPAGDVAALVVDLRRVATRLEAEIARAVHAASQSEIWRSTGATSMEGWLAKETQVSFRSARDQVRLAGTLAAAPLVAERMAEGGLSIDNVRLLGAVVGRDGFVGDAELLLEIASGSPRDTRRGLEQWLAMSDPGGEAEREEALWVKRHMTFTSNGEGMYDVKGLLMPVDVAAVTAALDHIAGAAYADETGRPHHTRIADAFVELCQAYNSGIVSGGRERPKVLIAVRFETVVERAASRGVIVGSNDTISGEQVRRLCCDAELNRVVTRGKSTILDYGTTTRLASDAQYYALVARDGGCRWPGLRPAARMVRSTPFRRSHPRRRAHRSGQSGIVLLDTPPLSAPLVLATCRRRRRPPPPKTRRNLDTRATTRTRLLHPKATPTGRRMNRQRPR